MELPEVRQVHCYKCDEPHILYNRYFCSNSKNCFINCDCHKHNCDLNNNYYEQDITIKLLILKIKEMEEKIKNLEDIIK